MNRAGYAALLATALMLPVAAEAEDLSPAYVQQVSGGFPAGTRTAAGSGTAAIVGSFERFAGALPAVTGPGNLALSLQDGVMNGAEIDQSGSRNMAAVLQTGAGNVATIHQSGVAQQAAVLQQGRNNVAVIHQR